MEDPVVLNYVRAGYVAAQLIILATYYYTSYQVRVLSYDVSDAAIDDVFFRSRRRTISPC